MSQPDPTDTTLGALLKARGFTPSEPAPAPAAPDLAGKIVLRRERKGRGGKTVTIVSGVTLPPPALDTLARDLRKALGTGAAVEGRDIVVHGDQTERLHAWLLAHGATKVVIGN
jgi:translation initiation factor 1